MSLPWQRQQSLLHGRQGPKGHSLEGSDKCGAENRGVLLTRRTSPELVEGVKTLSGARECGGRGRSWGASGGGVGEAARVLA